MPKKTADIALGKRKKAKGGSYKEHEEYKEKTRPVTILDMTPVKGEVIEAGMGSARKAAVKMARKMMQKMKGSKKASQTDANKATERLSKTEVPPSKLTPAELREAKAKAKASAAEAARDYKKYNRMQDEVIDLIHGTGPAGSKWKSMSTAGRKQLFDDFTGMSYESYMKKYATSEGLKQPKDLLKSLDEFYKAAID